MGHTGSVMGSENNFLSDGATPLPPAYLRPGAGRWDAEIVEKRSRFIGYAQRVESEAEARAFIEEIRAEHPAARHHCPAYAIHQVGHTALRHSSDDGEPSGTAGRPILAVLDGAGLLDIAVVVVRYFGGTLLGTGGLVRAYTDASAAVVRKLTVCRRVARPAYALTVGHAEAGRVEAELRGADTWEVVDTSYDGSGATLTVLLGEGRSREELSGTVAAMLGQAVELYPAGVRSADERVRNPLA